VAGRAVPLIRSGLEGRQQGKVDQEQSTFRVHRKVLAHPVPGFELPIHPTSRGSRQLTR